MVSHSNNEQQAIAHLKIQVEQSTLLDSSNQPSQQPPQTQQQQPKLTVHSFPGNDDIPTLHHQPLPQPIPQQQPEELDSNQEHPLQQQPPPSNNNHWLYTLLGADYEGTSALLPHWLDHYLHRLKYDPTRLLVLVNHNSTRPESKEEAAKVFSILKERDIPYRLWTGRYSSDAHLKIKLQFLQDTITSDEDWVTIADSDEFHEYESQEGGGGTAAGLVSKAEAAGANFIMGQMVDRVSSTGEITPVLPLVDIFAQYPFNCQVVRTVSNGHTAKVVAFKAYWRTNTGNHYVVTPEKAKEYFSAATPGHKNLRGGWMGAEDYWDLTPYAKHPEKYQHLVSIDSNSNSNGGKKVRPSQLKVVVPVYHMKWHKGVLQSARDRLEHYKGNATEKGGLPRYNHYVESERIVMALATGKIDMKAAGCVRAVPMRALGRSSR